MQTQEKPAIRHIKPEHRENFEKLRDYLIRKQPEDFHMIRYGTCLCGQAMKIGLGGGRDLHKEGPEDYLERIFGVKAPAIRGPHAPSEEWMFLFGSAWAFDEETNTPLAAAQRITAYLAGE